MLYVRDVFDLFDTDDRIPNQDVKTGTMVQKEQSKNTLKTTKARPIAQLLTINNNNINVRPTKLDCLQQH